MMKRIFRHDCAICIRLSFARLIVLMTFAQCPYGFYRGDKIVEDKGRTVRRIHVFTIFGRAFVFQNLYSSLGWMHPNGFTEEEFQAVWHKDWDWLEPGWQQEWKQLARERERKKARS